ncbi:LysR family transcriptional regulator [Agrobacterium larrymoorei]|uniref:HTH-type transcriptional regulator TtuA n=1 Tax=Agrobacterium larrymoorei TaxID=160699 RepID=A0A4D7DV59_9HYPH|nr:LysR family transcriptional regulator [Agrobacterium larrymoorei]QCI98429.1 LysR family transcriptional regulator [Agrobacterium larrymoorei]QYA06110.1 LysR family transcriptional regulator [Agrobacterium larrymoorei]
MDLDLRQLRSFVDVANLGSFSAAAEKAGLTQPAVSLHIRLLEKQLGVRLIERVGRRAQPTSAGRDLLVHARRIADEVSQAIETVAPHRSGTSGLLRIGTGATALIYFLPAILRQIRQALPGIEIRVETGNTPDILRFLEENEIDAAIVTLPASGRSLDIREIHQEGLVAIFPCEATGVPLEVDAEFLSSQPLLLYQGGNTRKLVDGWLRGGGKRVQPIMELGSVEALKKLVEAGLGVAIVPAMSIDGGSSGLQARSLTPRLERKLALALRRDKHMTAPLRALAAAINCPSED